MKTGRTAIAAVTALALLLCACAAREGAESPRPQPEQPSVGEQPNSRQETPAVSTPEPEEVGSEAPGDRYIDRMVQENVDRFLEPAMSEFEKAKAAFDYMIETATLLDPVGLELWRIRGDGNVIPSFVENRSLSILTYHIGKCEDYAAALTMLLRGAGLEAEYVPGLTYSAQGALVDHAWTIVRVDGTWYHLDCQLEQNISRHGSIRYKYFMKGDATMRQSHRWGQNLIDSRLLTEAQNEEIARRYLMQPCPQDYATPARQAITAAEAPDVDAIQAEIQAELAGYERAHGPLEPLMLDIIPPVFALEGYGPQD